ncbi:hypothetical protein T4B_9250 [Trichinella pseudospiralis]|uniref:Uncharacterized protein n=1 Tax=Trichinella pseudospiralis TaxID=6337 RepID=A0A0V1IWA1_TRIPS|nr:hypothetical protein T4B_9250 [Trichinella pseudospiralis]
MINKHSERESLWLYTDVLAWWSRSCPRHRVAVLARLYQWSLPCSRSSLISFAESRED